MAFTDELNKQFTTNIVIRIDGVNYAVRQPDSGLTVDADKLIVKDVTVSPTNVEIRNVNTTIPSVTFSLVDKNEVATANIMSHPSQFMEVQCIVFLGFNTSAGFDFSDYIILADTRIRQISKRPNEYRINAPAPTSLIANPSLIKESILVGGINDTDTTLTLQDASAFPISGRIRIGNEVISYSGKSTNDLTGLIRGDLSTTATAHPSGSDVKFLTELEDNPIDLMLQLMISNTGDLTNGAFDVIDGGLNIPTSLIDITTFTSIRDEFFTGENYRFKLETIPNTLSFLEQEILQATNTRFVIKNGLISLAVFDQVDIGETVPELNEDSTTGTPSYVIDSRKVVNRIIVNWNFDDGSQSFSRQNVFPPFGQTSDSIDIYGEKPPLTLSFQGVRADLNGSVIVANRANRLLSRLSTPRAEIAINSHFDNVLLNVGDKVLLTNRFLPQQGGGLGISEQLEILSNAIDLRSGLVKFKLQFTSFAGLRLGLVAPSPLIVAVTSQSIFEVPDGSCYRVDDVIYPDGSPLELRNIIDVNGNIITVDVAFSTTLTTSTRIKIADFDSASPFQRSRYAFIVDNDNEFDDGTKGYQIQF